MTKKRSKKISKKRGTRRNKIHKQRGGDDSLLSEMKALVKEGADVNIANDDGDTPLIMASKEGHVNVVNLLMENGAEVNKADDNDMTPLHWASYSGNLEVVQALLGAKADVDKARYTGQTPLSRALTYNHHRVAAVLREAGAH